MRKTSGVLAIAILSVLPALCRAAERDVPLTSLDLSHLEQGYGEPHVDRSVDNHEIKIGGKAYARGLGSHADSRFEVEVRGAKRFTASVGVDDETDPRGVVRFLAFGDGKLLFDSGPVKHGDAAKPVDVPLDGVKRLLLVAQTGGPSISFAHADWADATFVVDGDAPSAVEMPREAAEVLTPPAPKTPRINGAKVFGVRPGSPILFTVPATGERPIRFEATNLPAGATFDADTGLLGGAVKVPGTYVLHVKATNALGAADRDVKLVVGDEAIALTPPMGWNSWNCFAGAVDAEKVRTAADAMVSSGLIDHGWSYVNVDDFWQQKPSAMAKDPTLGGPGRDAEGNIVPNPRFPDMKGLADYVHGKGLKFGVYSSPGPLTCGGCLGSFGHEERDAKTYAAWGVDYLKYDWCSYRPEMEDRRAQAATQTAYPPSSNHTPVSRDEMIRPYRTMGEHLRAQPRDILYSLCQYGMGDVWSWGDTVHGNAWRTTGDIVDTWSSLSQIGFAQPEKQGVTGPGHWSDPDMLIVGRVGWGKPHPTRLTPNEQYTHISMWAILSAPMLIGCDMAKLDAFTLNLLTNDEVIAVNQDPLGRQAKRAAKMDTSEVWSKELEDGSVAVALFNRGEQEAEVAARWADLGVSGPRVVHDLWRQQDLATLDGEYRVAVPRHGVRFVRLVKP